MSGVTDPLDLLCVVAHPDDEARLCGGTLALLAARGVRVHVLCVTRGEGGELGEPPLATRETLGAVREQEMVCAVHELGGRSLTFLDYVDPLVGADNQLHAPDLDVTMLAAHILNSAVQARARVVLAHGRNGEYGHPAHVLVYQAALAAVASRSDPDWLLYTFAASFPDNPRPRLANADDRAHFVVDVSAVIERKVAAALCHRTQHALFVRRRTQELGRAVTVEEVVAQETREALRRQWPPAHGTPDDVLGHMLTG
jgi:LmbE family N-acetylglucosaminyl deacetylase